MNRLCLDGKRSSVRTFFTLGTRAVPGLSQRGAAVRLQGGSVDVHLTTVVDHLQPARALRRLWFIRSNRNHQKLGPVRAATRR